MLAAPVSEPLCADAAEAKPSPSGKAAELPKNFLREIPVMLPSSFFVTFYVADVSADRETSFFGTG